VRTVTQKSVTYHPHVELDTTTPAVILKLDRNVMHHGGLGAIRSLGRLGVPVYGVHEDAWAPAARSRYLHDRWVWRPPADDAERVRAGLVTLAERIGRPAVLIPTDDAGAIFLAEHGTELRKWFLFPEPASDLPRQVAGKYTLYQLCRELGVPCPAAALTGSLLEAQRFADRVGYPLVAKLATPWRSSSATGLRSTSVESRCRPGFVGIKERSYPAHAGLTSLGRWVDNPALHHQATELLTRLGFQGIVDLDYRFDTRDGRYKLLDFNPRLGAQFRLFSDTAGVDVVVAAHLDLTGRPVPPGAPQHGRRFLVENYDPFAALAYRRCGLDFRSWVTSLRQADELAWFAKDDLAPFGLMCLWMGWRAMTRPLRSAPRPPAITQLSARKA
jgi:D-aspartate ligase